MPRADRAIRRHGHACDVGSVQRRVLVGWVAGTICTGTFASVPGSSRKATPVAPGQVLSDGPLVGLNGPLRRLFDFRGQPLLINVWASWCGPCRGEMDSLERLAWREHGTSFNMIGISTDDDIGAARRLLESTNATISHFIDSRLRWETLLGASQLPLTVLVDPENRVIERIYGARQWDRAEAATSIDKAFGNHTAPRPG
jgi:thiol-disulfide isomerase/thioredoxin